MAFFVFGNRNLKKKRYKRIHVFVTTFLKQVFISLHDALNKLKVWKTNRMLGTIVHVMHRRIEQRLFPLLRIQCVGYGFIISLASPWKPRYQREKKKQKSRSGEERIDCRWKKKGYTIWCFLVSSTCKPAIMRRTALKDSGVHSPLCPPALCHVPRMCSRLLFL